MNLPYSDRVYRVDEEAFKRVVKEIEKGTALNLTMLGAIFGMPFWQLLALCLTGIVIRPGDKVINIYVNEKGRVI